MLTRLEGAHAFYVSIFGVVEHLRADKGTRLRLSGVVHLRRRIDARGQRVGGGGNSIMPESTDKVVIPESTYDVIELIGTSTESWEDTARKAIEQAGELCASCA